MIKRLERELTEKEQELLQFRRQNQLSQEHYTISQKLKLDNDQMLDTLHKEQDKSYKLLKDLHQLMHEGKQLKTTIEDQRAELDQLRHTKQQCNDLSADNERLKNEIMRMTHFIAE